MVSQATAREILSKIGWLSMQPEAFREEVLRHATLLHFSPGDVIYRHGDPPGGLYGIVQGSVMVVTAPPAAAARLFHVGNPGDWIGEGGFLSREPRRVGMQALRETWAVHLSLAVLDQMERRDPMTVRRVVQILLVNLDTLVEAFHNQQLSDEELRIASALLRVAPADGGPIHLSQEELAMIANTTRKRVNVCLRKFTRCGWIATGYRTITIQSPDKLQGFLSQSDA